MKKRSPATVVILTLLTFTLYAYYWLYTTTQELREQTGRKDLSPVLDVVLTLFTAGLWGIYAGYRNASIVHEELVARSERHENKALVVAAAVGASYFTGAAWLVAMALLQEEYNRLAEKPDFFASVHSYEETQSSSDYFDQPFEAPPPRARVAPARARVAPAPDVVTVSAETVSSSTRPSRAAQAAQSPSPSTPSAPVFVSDAPAPIVY